MQGILLTDDFVLVTDFVTSVGNYNVEFLEGTDKELSWIVSAVGLTLASNQISVS